MRELHAEVHAQKMDQITGIIGKIETFVRRFFERSGGAIDFALHRTSQLRTDPSALVPQIERAIETNLRTEGSRITAPNLIELRYDYETYTRMGHSRREVLQQELGTSIYEYIYNRRYATDGPIEVLVGYDAFTRGLEVHCEFGGSRQHGIEKTGSSDQSVETASEEPQKVCQLSLRGLIMPLEIHAGLSSKGEPAGVGRNVANQLVIRDVTVSNFHAALLIKPDGTVELADRDSANGTFVNGVLLAPGDKVMVRDGDKLKFGDVEMLLTIL